MLGGRRSQAHSSHAGPMQEQRAMSASNLGTNHTNPGQSRRPSTTRKKEALGRRKATLTGRPHMRHGRERQAVHFSATTLLRPTSVSAGRPVTATRVRQRKKQKKTRFRPARCREGSARGGTAVGAEAYCTAGLSMGLDFTAPQPLAPISTFFLTVGAAQRGGQWTAALDRWWP